MFLIFFLRGCRGKEEALSHFQTFLFLIKVSSLIKFKVMETLFQPKLLHKIYRFDLHFKIIIGLQCFEMYWQEQD